MPKYYECVLCKKHPKPKERRKMNKEVGRILRKCFMVENTAETYICNKCAHKCYKIKGERIGGTQILPDRLSSTKSGSMASPPSVRLPLASTSRGYSSCFVCKKPGQKLVVPALRSRFLAYVKSNVFIPAGARCCPGHIQNDLFSSSSLKTLKTVREHTNTNRSAVMDLLQEARSVILEREQSRLDFDDDDALPDENYYTLTGLSKANFNDLMTYVNDIRTSKFRSQRTGVALLLTKLRTSLNNKMLATLFIMTKSQVRRAVASGRKALMATFVPQHVRFQHISREEIRWVVESANGRIKSWKYLDRILPNNQIPYIGEYVRIICSLCNKYRPPLSTGNDDDDMVLATKMRYLHSKSTRLQQRVDDEQLDKRGHRWQKVDAEGAAAEFPVYSEDEIRELTLGVYQIKLAKSYTHEHLSEDGTYDILVDNVSSNLLSAKIQSRHTSAKQCQCWIEYNDGAVLSWYCKCKSGARVVGCCAHVASVIWYLSFARHCDKSIKGVRDWGQSVLDAATFPEPVNESESDDCVEE